MRVTLGGSVVGSMAKIHDRHEPENQTDRFITRRGEGARLAARAKGGGGARRVGSRRRGDARALYIDWEQGKARSGERRGR